MKIAAVLLSLLAGCSADIDQTYVGSEPAVGEWTVTVDDGVSPGDVEEFLSGAEAWRRAVAGTCPIVIAVKRGTVDDSLPVGTRSVTAKYATLPNGEDGHSAWAMNLSANVGARMELRPGQNGERLRAVVMHELGHAFRLGHFGSGVMHRDGGPSITSEEVSAFGAMWCPI